jgi:hypothetical protein
MRPVSGGEGCGRRCQNHSKYCTSVARIYGPNRVVVSFQAFVDTSNLGCMLSKQSKWGSSPLEVASRNGHRAVVDYLTMYVAEAAKTRPAAAPPPPGTATKRQRTDSSTAATSRMPMGKPAEEGDLGWMRAAIKEGAEVNQVSGPYQCDRRGYIGIMMSDAIDGWHSCLCAWWVLDEDAACNSTATYPVCGGNVGDS